MGNVCTVLQKAAGLRSNANTLSIVPQRGHYRELLYSAPKGTKKGDFFGFFGFMLSWFSEFFEGKSLFSRYLKRVSYRKVGEVTGKNFLLF